LGSESAKAGTAKTSTAAERIAAPAAILNPRLNPANNLFIFITR